MEADPNEEKKIEVKGDDEHDEDEDDDDDESHEDDDRVVYLGFIDPECPLEPQSVNIDFFKDDDGDDDDELDLPSHIGGYPQWIHNEEALNIPASVFSCPLCHNPMSLLVQLYAPLDWLPHAHHRLLHLFVCPSAECWKKKSSPSSPPAVLLRSQCVSSHPPSPPCPQCSVCGKPSRLRCGHCKSARYCGEVHQKMHWRDGHQRACGEMKGGPHVAAEPPFAYPHFAIETEEEKKPEKKSGAVEDDVDVADVASGALVKKFEGNVNESSFSQAGLKKSVRDPQFSLFRRRTLLQPDQMLRYSFGAVKPLWVTSSGQMVGDATPCGMCGGKRVCEFQLMPQLLHYLALDKWENYALDWNTLVAYTCEKSCHSDTSCYIQEFIHVQDT